MGKLTKNKKIALEKFEAEKQYKLIDAANLVKEITTTKFDASVDLDVRLGVDPRKANQMVRGIVTLPHGTGKEIKVLVLCTPDKEDEAIAAGSLLSQKRFKEADKILMKETLAGKVRKIMEASPGEIRTREIAEKLDLVFDKEKQPLYQALRDFVSAGEIEKIRQGVFIYKGRKNPAQLQEIMWRFLRARKKVTIDDLIEISRAEKSYVKEWLQLLVRREIVRKYKNGNYLMIKDPVDMPKNEKKAQRLRRIRAEKKKALDAIDKVVALALEARMAVVEIEE